MRCRPALHLRIQPIRPPTHDVDTLLPELPARVGATHLVDFLVRELLLKHAHVAAHALVEDRARRAQASASRLVENVRVSGL